MSSRTSRASRPRRNGSKGAKISGSLAMKAQAKVTEFFPTVRRGKSAGKRMKIEVSTTLNEHGKSEIIQNLLDTGDSSTAVPYDFSKIAAKASDDGAFSTKSVTVKAENNSSFLKDFLVIPSNEASSGKDDDSAAPTFDASGHRKPAKRRLLFDDQENVSASAPAKEGDADVSSSDDIIFTKSRIVSRINSNSQKNARTVRELQEKLAHRGVASRLHKQNSNYILSKVVDGETSLLSPKKLVGFSLKPSHSPLKPIKVFPASQKNTSKINENLDSSLEDYKKSRSDWLNYGRASLLKAEVKNSASLKLPVKYENLLKLFESTERVISMFQARDMKTPLNLIMRNVVAASKCAYTVKDFARIVFLYPLAYKIRVEECKSQGSGFEGRFEYVVETNLVDDIRDYMERDSPVKITHIMIPPPPFTSPAKGRIVGSPRKTPVKVAPLPRAPALDLRTRLEAWRLIVRAAIFKHCIVEFILKHNGTLLEKLQASMNSENGDCAVSCNDLDDALFEDIPEAILPELPKGDGSLRKNMRDYLRAVEDSYNTLPTKVQDAIALLRSPDGKAAFIKGRQVPLSPRKYASSCKENAKGLSLLERIRAKDLEKKRIEALRDPEKELKRARLQELLQYIRDLCRLFLFKKVGSMALPDLVEKMCDGSARSHKSEVEAQIVLLTEVAKDFAELKEIRGKKYISLKQNSASEIIMVLHEELKKCC